MSFIKQVLLTALILMIVLFAVWLCVYRWAECRQAGFTWLYCLGEVVR